MAEKNREKLTELLGLDLIEKCDLDFKEETVEDFKEYTQIRFSFQREPGYYVPAYIQIPKNYEGKLIPMICLQGHSTGMHISLGIQKFPGDDVRVSRNNGAVNAAVYQQVQAATLHGVRTISFPYFQHLLWAELP